ncbi:unnamed protein product, partial [Polarella glacialis]
MDDTIRCAIVMSRALPRARDHLRFLPQKMLQNYATLRNAIRLQELRGRSYDQLGHPARATAAVIQYWPGGGSGDGDDDVESLDVSWVTQSSGRKVGRAGPKGKGKGQGKGKSDTAPAPARPAPSTSSTRVPTSTARSTAFPGECHRCGKFGHRAAECRAAAPRPKVLELCNDETALQGHYDARELQAPEAIATIQAVEQQDGVW